MAAILTNFDIVEDAIAASEGSAGSALAENEKVLNSIEGKIKQFTNSTELFWSNLLDDEVIKFFVDLGTMIVQLASDFGELRSVIFGILMYFNLSKKYPFDLASKIFGPNGISKLLSGLRQAKKETGELLGLYAPGLPAPQERLGLPAAQTSLVPAGPTSLTPTNASSLMPTSQMSEEERRSFFTNMINNARMASQSIWQLFMNMINKLKTAASNIFTGAFNTVKTKIGNFTNQIKKTYYKATNQAFMTDESGKVRKAQVVDRRMSVYEGSESSDAKTASKVSQMWQNHMGRLRDSIGRVKQDISTVWQHHNERVAQSVQYASTQFNKLKASATNTFGKISAVTSNVANGIKGTYSKVADSVRAQALSIRNAFVKSTSKAYMADEAGRVHRAKVLPTNMPTAYEQPEQSYNKINEAINRIKTNLHNTVENGKWMFEDLATRVGYQFNKIRTNIGNAISGTFNNIRSNVESGFNKTINSVSTAFNKIKSKFGKQSSTSLVPFDDRGTKQSYSGFTATAKKVSAEVNRIWAKHIDNLNGSFKGVQNEFTRIWANHKVRVADSVTHAKSQFASMTSGVSAQFATMRAKISATFSGITNTARTAATSVKNFFSKFFNPVIKGFQNVTSKIKAIASDTATAFKARLGYTGTSSGGATPLDVSSIFQQAGRSGEKLSLGNDIDYINNEIAKLNNMDNAGITKFVQDINNMGNAATPAQKALASYVATTNDVSYSSKGASKHVQAHNASIKSSGIAAAAAAVGHQLLNAAISMGISFIISTAISWLTSLINKQKELRSSAIETANTFKEQSKQLKDYKAQIQELRAELDAGNLSESEAYNTREQLISIQQELIDNFGLEAEGINLVTGSIESQIKAIDDLNKKNAQVWLNENYKAMNDAIDYFETSTKDPNTAGTDGITNWGLTSRVNQSVTTHASEREHANVASLGNMGMDLFFDGTPDERKAEIEHWLDWFRQEEQIINQEIKNASAQNNQELVTSLQKDLAQTQDFIEDLSASYKKYFGEGSTYTQNKQIVEQAQQNTAITQYADQMSVITSAEQAYQEAIKSGNKTTANEALEDINAAIEAASSDASANGQQFMVEFFNGMKKGYQDANFEKDLSEDKSLNDKVTKALGNFDDTLELGNTSQHTDEQKKAYESLAEVADEYGYEIEDLIKLLGMLGKIKVSPTVEVKQENVVDWEKTSEAIDNIQEAYDTLTDVVKQYNSTGYLTLDNLQALLSLEPQYLALLQMENGQLSINQAAMEAMVQAKLAEAKANVITSTIKQLDTLATNAQAKAIATSTGAASGSIGVLGSYANALSNVGEEALLASGQILAFKAAIDGAETAGASEAEINNIISNMNAQLAMIDSLGANLSGNFGKIVSPSSSSSSSGKTALEKIQEYYERQIKDLEGQQTYIENEIEKLEAQEEGVSADYYEKQIDLEEEKIALYEQERAELLKLKRTDEVADAIWEVEHAIQESTLRMIEFRKSISELYATASERITDAYGRQQQLSDDRTSLIENEISIRETKGELIPTSAYDDLIAEAQASRANAEAELNAQADLYWQGVNSGDFEEGSDEALDILEKIRQKKLDMQEASKQEAEYIEQQKDAYIAYYDKMMEAYSYRNDFIQGQSDFAQSYIDRLGTLDINVPDEAYEEIAKIQELSAEGLKSQLAFANKELLKFEAQGIDKNDPRYIEKFNEALALEKEIYDKETEVYETHQQIFDNQIDRFNQVIDRINDATQKLQNISGLVDNEDVATEDGEWTAEGLTQLGMAYQQMEYYKQSADEVAEKMAEVEEAYKRGEISEKKYYETMQELENQQWDTINSYKDMEDAIVDLNEARIDMIEQGLDKEIEAMEELIQLKRDELDAERDLFDFKKDVEKQTKDIAALERRIASMGGSSDASTIAERTKLEQQLREAKEGLDDTFYNHAMDSQSNALDDELKKFTESSEDYLESLRESIKDTDLLIETTFTDVMQNGQTVLETLTTLSNTYGFQLDGYLTAPWINATNKSIDFDTYATSHFNAVYTAVETKTSDLTGYLKAPWEAGRNQAEVFSTETQRYMTQEVVEYAEKNYKEQLKSALNYPWEQANGQASWGKGIQSVLSQAVKDAEEAGRKIAEALDVEPPSYESVGTSDTGGTGKPGGYVAKPAGGTANIKALQEVLNSLFGTKLSVDGSYGSLTKAAVKTAQTRMKKESVYSGSIDGLYGSGTASALSKYIDKLISNMKKGNGSSMIGQGVQYYQNLLKKVPAAMYAKGTMGTKKDQWALDSEPWLGDEIVLVPGQNGNLSYMRKGTAVMPADISANLVEWGKLDPTMMSIGDMTGGIQMMSNYVNKPEIKLDIENFLKVGTVSKDTLPELEKLMDKKIDTFAKQLNQSLRKFK